VRRGEGRKGEMVIKGEVGEEKEVIRGGKEE
jgi:hypothetical protein